VDSDDVLRVGLYAWQETADDVVETVPHDDVYYATKITQM